MCLRSSLMVSLLFFSSFSWKTFGVTRDLEKFKQPKGECDQIINYSYYSLCYSKTHRQAKWTSYLSTKDKILGRIKRTNDYRADWNVNDPVAPEDFRGSGHDRGHLVPAGSMKISKTSMSETFFMTNMSPQTPELNREIWRLLEEKIRSLVLEKSKAWVITGPVLDRGMRQLPSKISIPKRYFKIVYFPKLKKMWAFLIPNLRSFPNKNYRNYLTSVDRIEDITNLDFFSELEDGLEEKLESSVTNFP